MFRAENFDVEMVALGALSRQTGRRPWNTWGSTRVAGEVAPATCGGSPKDLVPSGRQPVGTTPTTRPPTDEKPRWCAARNQMRMQRRPLTTARPGMLRQGGPSARPPPSTPMTVMTKAT